MSADSVWSLGNFLPEDSGPQVLALTGPFLPWQAAQPDQSEIPTSYGQDVVGWSTLRELLHELRSDTTTI